MSHWYEIAGVGLRLDGDLVERDLWLERYGPFAIARQSTDVCIEVESDRNYYNEAVAGGKIIGEDPYVLRDGQWTIHRLDYEAVFVDPRHLRARTDGTLGALNGLLRHVLSWALHERGGLLLHAAGLRIGSEVVAFAGPSGAGKTTACRHAPSWAAVLGDEHIALRPEAGEMWAWGTPIVGELARPGKPDGGPLRALHFLEHAAGNRITPLDTREIVRRLVPCVVFYPRDRRTNDQALEACLAVAAQVRAYRLEALGDGSFWPQLAETNEAAG